MPIWLGAHAYPTGLPKAYTARDLVWAQDNVAARHQLGLAAAEPHQ